MEATQKPVYGNVARVVHNDPQDRKLLYRELNPRSLLLLTLENPGFSTIAMIIGSLEHSPMGPRIRGSVGPNLRLDSATHNRLLAAGIGEPNSNTMLGIFGSTPLDLHQDAEVCRVLSVGGLEIGQRLVWGLWVDGQTAIMVSPGRISQMEVRTK